jgi:hypothetical protein
MQSESKVESSALKVVERSDTNGQKTSVRRGTGPRTAEGKRRSKRNATKHGLFSSIVLPWESAAEYQSLRNNLWKSFQPEGAAEELLVDKLAVLAWRHRRLLVAERAEIEAKPAVSSNSTVLKQLIMGGIESPTEDELIRRIANPTVLERCLKLLNELREQLDADFNEERAAEILGEIYGAQRNEETHRHPPLVEIYLYWNVAVQALKKGGLPEGFATPEEYKQDLSDEIDGEIKRLELQRIANASAAVAREESENHRRGIPAEKFLNRLLRCEASLERSFDRTLNQFERLQRTRRGQPVAPRIEVSLSH